MSTNRETWVFARLINSCDAPSLWGDIPGESGIDGVARLTVELLGAYDHEQSKTVHLCCQHLLDGIG